MNKKTIFRIVIDLILFLAVLNGWWFIVIPFGFFGVYTYLYFIEILIAGIMYDSLFGFIPGMGVQAYIGTIVAVIIIVIMNLVKRVVRK